MHPHVQPSLYKTEKQVCLLFVRVSFCGKLDWTRLLHLKSSGSVPKDTLSHRRRAETKRLDWSTLRRLGPVLSLSPLPCLLPHSKPRGHHYYNPVWLKIDMHSPKSSQQLSIFLSWRRRRKLTGNERMETRQWDVGGGWEGRRVMFSQKFDAGMKFEHL